MSTREKKKDAQTGSEVLSNRLTEAADDILKKTKSLTDSFKQIKNAVGKDNVADDAYAHLKSNLDGSDIKKNAKDLGIAISVAIRDANLQRAGDLKSLKGFIDAKERPFIKQLEISDQMLEKLKDLTSESRKLRMELAKGQANPQILFEKINREINDPLADHPQDIYLGLIISEFVSRKFNEVKEAINNGETDRAKSILQKYSDAKEVENELINGPSVQSMDTNQQSDKRPQSEQLIQVKNEKAHEALEPVQKPRSSKQEPPAEEHRKTRPKVYGKVPRSQWPAGDWVSHVKDYYKHFAVWAELNEQEKERMEGMIKELNKTNSMSTALDLWRAINTKWVERTNSLVDRRIKDDFAEEIKNAATSEEATKTGRRMLVHHANYYKYQIAGLFDDELVARRNEIAEKIKKGTANLDDFKFLFDHSVGERLHAEFVARSRLRKAEEKDRERLEAELRKELEITSKFFAELTKEPIGLYKPIVASAETYSTRHFYEHFNRMNEADENHDYLNREDDLMWAYMFRVSFVAWKQNKLTDADKGSPPPLEFPDISADAKTERKIGFTN